MVVTVHSQHFLMTPSIKQFALENLQQPLEQIWRRGGTELDIHLRDLRGGDKQGLDKECRCVFYTPSGPKLVITEVTEDMRKSIHQVRRRLMRRVRQQVSHRLDENRRHRKHYFADMANNPPGDESRGASRTMH